MQPDDARAYDRGVTVFSPDGRLYQVEYAREAVARGSPSVGVRTADAVVLAARSRPRSSLVEPASIEKLHDVDGRVGMASAGHVADARRLVDVGREFAQRERLRYGEAPGVEPVATAVADFLQESTQTGGTRPFGAALLAGGTAASEPRLFEVDPSGTPSEWRATAIGSESGEIRRFLEDEYSPDLGTEAGVSLALRSLSVAEDADLEADVVDVAVAGSDGYDVYDRDRTAAAIATADDSPAS